MRITSATLAALVGTTASAHMQMQVPAPFNSKFNPYTPFNDIDYSMTSPLLADGSNYPCKGYHALLGTPAGRPTGTFEVGSRGSITVSGGATHNGGSCQVSLSTDGARTFTVLKSIIGNCPADYNVDLGFTIPPDAPTGDAVLAWSWHNRIGNREMYMNCAAVTLTSGGSPRKRAAGVAYSSRPGIFVANVANGCSVAEGGDVVYPDPGPDAEYGSTNPIAPDGDCGPSSSLSSSSSSSPPPAPPLQLQPQPQPQPQPPSPPISGGRTEGYRKSTRPSSLQDPEGPAADTPQPPATTLEKEGEEGQGTPRGGGGAGAGAGVNSTPGTACADEGAWDCLPDGKAFQRCASGQWSVAMPVAPGTYCVPGYGSTIDIRAA